MINLAFLSSRDSWALSLSRFLLLLNLSSLSVCVRALLCTRGSSGTTTNCGDFPICIGNFCARDVRTISTSKCGAFRFLLGIFVHAMYVPFQLLSVGLSGFFREFSCTRRTYHGHLTILGLAQARPNNTMGTKHYLILVSYIAV